MSKSLGNSPDLLELIERYGADAVRFGIMISSPAGNDLLFDEGSLEQGRNFNNKLWNALKLVKMWEGRVREDEDSIPDSFAIKWFESRLNEVRREIEKMYSQYRPSEVLKTIYSLIWDDFCSWYLEWVKPGFEQPIASSVYQKTIGFFEDLVQLLHPFMPFITEEIYHLLRVRKDDLCVKQFEPAGMTNKEILAMGEDLTLLLTGGREFRQQNNMKQSTPIKKLIIPDSVFGPQRDIYSIIQRQLNVEEISGKHEASSGESSTITSIYPFKNHQLTFLTEQVIDLAKRKEELEKELEYHRGFLNILDKKLSNERFIQNAKPEVIELEKKKRYDAEGKIRAIEDSLMKL